MSEDNADYGCPDAEIKCAYCGSTDVCLAEYDIDLYECNVCGRTFIFAPGPATEEKLAVFEQHGGTVQAVSDYVRPLPCVRDEHGEIKEQPLKLLIGKVNEELDELKEAIIVYGNNKQSVFIYPQEVLQRDKERIAEEAADTITSITTILAALEIDEEMRNKAQMRVNEKNRERGRL